MGSGSGRPSYEDGTALLFSETTAVIGAVCAAIFAIIGTLGNVLTILALTQSTLRSHPTTLCLVSLAISDLIFSMYNLPLLTHRFINRGCEFMCLDWHMCKYYPFFFFGNIGVSVWTMMLIAMHRVFGVFYGHLLEKVFNQVSVLLMIMTVWLISFGVMYFPLTETWGQFGYDPQIFACTIMESEGETFMPMMTAAGIGIPCVVITLSYLAIYWKVKSTGRATRRAARGRDGTSEVFGPHTMAAQTKQRERSITITFSLIFITFIVCYLPNGLLILLDPIPPSQLGWLHMVSYILTWTSAFINPVIYCLVNKYYLDTFKQLFKRLRIPVHCSREADALDTSQSSPQTEETMQEELLKRSLRQTTSFSKHGVQGEMVRIQER